MFDSFNLNIASKHVLKDGLFRTTEAQAGSCYSADGTMIFHQKETIPLLAPGGHIPFSISDFSELRDLLPQRPFRAEQSSVTLPRVDLSSFDQFFKRFFAQDFPDSTNQLRSQFRVRIREPLLRRRRQTINLNRSAYSADFGL